MRSSTLWRQILGVEEIVVEGVDFDGAAVVVEVRPRADRRGRCGVCQRRAPGYDEGRGRRRWRGLDLGVAQMFIESDAPRVNCRRHGVVVAHVPWARHGSVHTVAFEQQVAWLATQTSKTAVTALMRVAWRTVGAIVERTWQAVDRSVDRFAGLTRIGIDEVSYRRGHWYLTVVTDHLSGRVVWVAPGRDMATLQQFFDVLGADRCGLLSHVAADGADYIAKAVARNCPNAIQGADPFHVVKWANDALADVRVQAWREARRLARLTEPARGRGRPPAGSPPRPATAKVKALQGVRSALWKNPENLTERQRAKLEWVALTDPKLHRAYQLKEALRLIFKMPIDQAREALDRWISMARRSRIDAFVRLQRTVTAQRDKILTSIEHGLSNARSESVNTKIRLLTRTAFGFASPESLIALIMLSLGGHRPTLPGRKSPTH